MVYPYISGCFGGELPEDFTAVVRAKTGGDPGVIPIHVPVEVQGLNRKTKLVHPRPQRRTVAAGTRLYGDTVPCLGPGLKVEVILRMAQVVGAQLAETFIFGTTQETSKFVCLDLFRWEQVGDCVIVDLAVLVTKLPPLPGLLPDCVVPHLLDVVVDVLSRSPPRAAGGKLALGQVVGGIKDGAICLPDHGDIHLTIHL